jgi:hypothetical protein
MSEKPYYGYKALPPNKRRGTPSEALDANQIRYWGIKPTPPDVLKTGTKKQIEKLEVKRAKLHIRMKHGLQEHKYEANPKKKARIAKRLKKLGDQFEQLGKEVIAIRKT